MSQEARNRKKRAAHSSYYYYRIKAGLRGAVLLIVAAAAIHFFSLWRASLMTEQQAAQRWEPSGGFAQISVFLASEAGMQASETGEVKALIMQTLSKDSIEPDKEIPGDKILESCASGFGTVTVRAAGKTIEADAVGTYGEFFLFHPVQLLGGSYYTSSNLMKDQVLLDEETAWALYGAYEVEGRTVMIGESTHTIAGVFRRPAVGFGDHSGLGDALVYIPYESLLKNAAGNGAFALTDPSGGSAAGLAEPSNAGNEGGSSGTYENTQSAAVTDNGRITCFEVVMPDPVEGYALQIVKDCIGRDERQIVCTDNTARYTPRGLLNSLRAIGTWETRLAPVRYPYWENAAVCWQEVLTLLLLAEGVFALIAACLLVRVAVFIYNNRRWSLAAGINAMQQAVYERQSEKLYPEYYSKEKEKDRER